jgi:hypothetical protein
VQIPDREGLPLWVDLYPFSETRRREKVAICATCMEAAQTYAEEVLRMKKRIALFVTALALATSGVASAAVNNSPGAGNPDTNASGKCPPGQNTDTSVGGLKKCP